MKAKQIFSILITIASAFILLMGFMLYTDNPVFTAKSMYPLGQQHAYIIIRNQKPFQFSSGDMISPNSYYTFIRAGEEEQSFPILGRALGKSKIDLEPFLNIPVWIEGGFEWGNVEIVGTTSSVPKEKLRRVVLVVENIHRIEEK
jgi:hypothetical protein